MVTSIILMLVGGIGLTQAISDPKQVTLGWLRLGGMICLALLVVAATVIITYDGFVDSAANALFLTAAVGVACFFQLTTAQLAKRNLQRLAALISYVLSSVAICLIVLETLSDNPNPLLNTPFMRVGLMITPWLDCGLLGGFLMAMLLGHAYLTAGGEMTQAPFMRLVMMLGALIVLRAIVSCIFGLWPFLTDDQVFAGRASTLWPTVMVTARYLVGLIVPGIFTYMIYDCVKRRANQSATGILYVANVLIIVGEGVALSLINSTGMVF